MSKRKNEVVKKLGAFRPPIEVAAAATSTVDTPKVTSIARQRMIAEAAYYRAEKRGFAPGGEFDDWIAAEQYVAGISSLDPVDLH